jgi:hypothetical protein
MRRRPRPDRLPGPYDCRLSQTGLTPSGTDRSGTDRSGTARRGLGVVGVALGLGVLAGCGTSAAGTPNAGQTCGRTRTGVNVPVIIKISEGPVSCATALRVENSYAAVVRTGQIRGNGGGAPVTVSGWTCRGFPTTEVLKTGQASACRSGGAEILAILPPPSTPSMPITPIAAP